MKKLILCAILFLTAFSVRAENPRYKISVTHGGKPLGDIVIELYADAAPKHTHNFDSLVSVGFYNTTAFHRVVPGFVIQGGGINSQTARNKPRNTWGISDASQTKVPAEFSTTLKHRRGIISGARLGNDINSYTSQFFICLATLTNLDNNYSIFGEVVSGMDVVDKIVAVPRDLSGATLDNPKEKVEMMVEKFFGTGIQDSTEKENSDITISPNPADTYSKISFNLLKDETVKLEITNNLGEKVSTLYEGNLAKGPHEFIWNTVGSPDGNYFYSLETSEEVKSGKIVVVKK